MKITEVRVVLNSSAGESKLKAYCTITLDNKFVVTGLKLVQSVTDLFLAMPSRKFMVRCVSCQAKNVIIAKYCNWCGKVLPECPLLTPKQIHYDICHPISNELRLEWQAHVVNEYNKALLEFKRSLESQEKSTAG